jgi:hypothetical protein
VIDGINDGARETANGALRAAEHWEGMRSAHRVVRVDGKRSAAKIRSHFQGLCKDLDHRFY